MIAQFMDPESLYLKHPSVLNVQKASAFERYELLGDKVLGFCVVDLLFKKYPEHSEGTLSRMANMLVSKKVLAQVAQNLQIEKFFSYNLQSISLSVYASMCEVIIAALYIEKGWGASYEFVKQHWQTWLNNPLELPVDYKTLLQEYAAREHFSHPKYEVVDKKGPDHKSIFTCMVSVEEIGSAQGQGRSKHIAEEQAVQMLCSQYRIKL